MDCTCIILLSALKFKLSVIIKQHGVLYLVVYMDDVWQLYFIETTFFPSLEGNRRCIRVACEGIVGMQRTLVCPRAMAQRTRPFDVAKISPL